MRELFFIALSMLLICFYVYVILPESQRIKDAVRAEARYRAEFPDPRYERCFR